LITVDVEGIKQKAQEVGRGVADNARATAGEVGSKVSFSPSKGFPMLVAGIVVFVVCSIIQGIFGSSMFDRSYSPSQAGIVGAILLNITFWPGWLLTIGCLLGGLRAMFKSTESEKNELMKEAETARIQGDISKAEELEARARNVK
jgi:hypothetical protein